MLEFVNLELMRDEFHRILNKWVGAGTTNHYYYIISILVTANEINYALFVYQYVRVLISVWSLVN